MAAESNQFLPNDATFQVDFRPNSLLLDHRGEWAKKLRDAMEVEHWRITDNQIDVFDEARKVQAYVGFKRLGGTIVDAESRDALASKATRFLEQVTAFPEFGARPYIERIGVLLRFCTKFSGSLDELVKKILDQCVDVRPDFLKSFSETARLTDVSAPFHLSDEHGSYKMNLGPMHRDQSSTQFFVYKKAPELPDVGLYFECDSFKAPKTEMGVTELATTISAFSNAAWDRHSRIRKLIISGR